MCAHVLLRFLCLQPKPSQVSNCNLMSSYELNTTRVGQCFPWLQSRMRWAQVWSWPDVSTGIIIIYVLGVNNRLTAICPVVIGLRLSAYYILQLPPPPHLMLGIATCIITLHLGCPNFLLYPTSLQLSGNWKQSYMGNIGDTRLNLRTRLMVSSSRTLHCWGFTVSCEELEDISTH